MKILGLQIQGIGKIKAMELSFKDKGLIPIVGTNNQGKTTIIKCLEMLMSGGSLPNDIINHDSKKGEIVAQIDDYQVKKVITDKTTRLEVSTNNSIMKNPQTFLCSLINKISFNPFNFINKSGNEKLREMMNYAGINFQDIDKMIINLEAERRVVGREVKNMGKIDKVDHVSEIELKSLYNSRDEIEKSNAKLKGEHYEKVLKIKTEILEFNNLQRQKEKNIEDKQKDINFLEEAGDKALVEIKQIENGIMELNERLAAIRHEQTKIGEKVETRSQELKELPLVESQKDINKIEIDGPVFKLTEEIDTQIQVAKTQNEEAKKYTDYLVELSKQKEKQKEYDDLGNDINSRREGKKETLKNVKLPVEDLEIREDGLYYKDTYSENLSTTEALKLASLLCLTQNPKLRAITIDRGESFDKENIKFLEKWGIENDMQCFITIVDEIPDIKQDGIFYIEEGELIVN